MKITHFFLVAAMLVSASSAGAEEVLPAEEQEFSIDRQLPSWYNHYRGSRTPRLLYEFTAKVDLKAARGKIYFVDDEKRRIAAALHFAEEGDYPEHVEPLRDGADPEGGEPLWPRRNAIVVTPVLPLPVGEDWELRMEEGIRELAGKRATREERSVDVGSVKNLEISRTQLWSRYDSRRRIDLSFNKALAEEIAAADLDGWIEVVPKPVGLRFSREGNEVRVDGDYEFGVPYRVSVAAGLPAKDGTLFPRDYSTERKFSPRPAYLSLPSENATRRLSGVADFEFLAANLKTVRVRAKRVEGNNLLYAMRAYELYASSGRSEDGRKVEVVPYDAVAGQTVFSKEFSLSGAIDASEKLAVAWAELMGEAGPGAVFIDVEGVPRDEVKTKGRLVAQSLVQVTDLGLVMKLGRDEGVVFAFSQESGEPKAGLALAIYDREKTILERVETDAQGVARVTVPETAHWVVAEGGGDRLAAEFGEDLRGLSLWHYGISVRPGDLTEVRRRTMMFTDRSLYEPGDTVHLKALSRVIDGEGMRLPIDGMAQLKLTDPRNRVVLDRKVDFTDLGSLDDEIHLPGKSVGWYRMTLDFGDAAEGGSNYWDRTIHHRFRVDEYRPNTFEVNLEGVAGESAGGEVPFRLSANYFMGKPLSKATYSWTAKVEPAGFAPETYSEFYFGWTSRGERETGGHSYHGRGELSAEGEAQIVLSSAAAAEGQPGPLQMRIHTKVVDINQQTISKAASVPIDGSDFYLGVKRLAAVQRPGEEVRIEAVAVRPDGSPYEEAVELRCLVERREWNAVRMKLAGGGTVTRNTSVWIVEEESELEIGGEAEAVMEFSPEAAGNYVVSLIGEDAQGRPVKTRMGFYVQGQGEGTFVRREGTRIDLATDKERYVPGETARVAVKSPIAGTALITVERNRVRREYVREIAEGGDLIEIPIGEGEGPNLFLSALVVRGSADCPRKLQEPDFKIGYCEIIVDDDHDRLEVELEPGPGSYRPGEPVVIEGRVRGNDGVDVAGAEVTLYAVDEGVLSLMGYKTPDAFGFFNAPFPLGVKSEVTLTSLLREDSKDLTFGNKGRLIGGGGEAGFAPVERLREDFRATALWNGGLRSDAEGRFRAEFAAPDSLTRYRVMAVVCAGAKRFGQVEGAFEVRKPLMIEPALARFGNAGDRIEARGVVYNTSEQGGRFLVSLAIDETSAFGDGGDAEVKKRSRELELAAGETAAVSFPVRFENPGAAEWTWEVASVELDGERSGALRDSRVSRFDVGHPVPLLKQSRYARVEAGDVLGDLLAGIDADLLDGEGTVTVSLSRSRIMEAADALEYILRYPYGCVEQTTSSLLPWMRLTGLGGAVPILDRSEEEVRAAVQAGADRLLSMQTDSGGLAYWPGGRKPDLWGSAYGGLGLTFAVERGAELPKGSVEGVYKFLSKELRAVSTERDQSRLIDLCFGIYTLALADRAEHGYHEVLFKRRAELSREARSLLAMAIVEGGGEVAMARALLEEGERGKASEWRYWLGPKFRSALGTMAWATVAPRGAEAQVSATDLLKLRDREGHWGSTHNNAWATLALGRLAEEEEKGGGALAGELSWGKGREELEPLEGRGEASAVLSLDDLKAGEGLRFANLGEAGATVQVKVESRDAEVSMEAVDRGYAISRRYFEVHQDGGMTPASDLEVGDLVLVQLRVSSEGAARYMVIDDRLPCLFEAINPNFESQRTEAPVGARRWSRWRSDHQEMRTERVVFFQNWMPSGGHYEVEYLARVIAEGHALAPAAKIEEMYEPGRHGLSKPQYFRIPAGPEAVEGVVAGVLSNE